MNALQSPARPAGRDYSEPRSARIDPRVERRNWLLSEFDEITWTFSKQIPGNEPASMKLNWKVPVSGNTFLTDPPHELWLEIARHATWWYRESTLTGCKRSSSCHAFGSDLRRFICWCIRSRIERPREITTDDVEDYVRYLKTLEITESTAESRLGVIRMLWLLRDHLPEGLKFEPFAGSGELRLASRRAGVPNKHTTTLPPTILFELLNEAIRWIEHEDVILAARDCYLDARKDNAARHQNTGYLRSLAVVRATFGRSYLPAGIVAPPLANTTIKALEWALASLYGAAIVIILSFTSMRKHELALLEEDPLDNRGAVDFLLGLVRKPSETEAGIRTERAIHPIGISAIRVLERLSERARLPSTPELLLRDSLISRNTAGRAMTTGDVYNMLDRFAAAAGYESRVQMRPLRPLRPHMLRRAPVLLWAWRYELGDLELLRRHLYHKNIKSTLAYTSEADISEYLPEEQQRVAYSVLEEALTGRRPIKGGFGKLLARFRSMIRVLPVARLQTFVTEFVEKHALRLIAHPQGYCVVSASRAKLAACGSNGSGPDYGNRTDEHCAFCPNFGVHRGFEDHWRLQKRIHKAIVGSPDSSPILRAAALEGLRACDHVLQQIAEH